MKNNILISILFLLFVLSFCSSVQIEMKPSYDLGETLVVKISGNFVEPILEQNIYFYRRHMQTAMFPNLVKIENDYYIYLQIPFEKIPDNYSILIQGVKYLQGTQIKEDTLFYNFSITNETADFSIEPAVLVASTDFYILVQNLQNNQISLEFSISNETSSSGGFWSFFTSGDSSDVSSFTLTSGEIKNINFKLAELNAGLNTIRISSDNLEYFVSVYAIKEKEKPKFYFEEPEINLSLIVNSSESRKIIILNSGGEKINNIFLSLSNSLKPYVNLSTSLIKELKSNSSTEVTLTFFSDEGRYVEGFLRADQEDKVRFLTIYFNSIEDYKPLDNITSINTTNTTNTTKTDIPKSTKTCSELGGTPCGGDLVCSVDIIEASDDKCCVGGECSEKKASSANKIIGWSLLILTLLGFLWFLTKKYTGTKNKINFYNAFRKR